MKILIIDDDPICLMALKQLLISRFSYEVDVFESPLDALKCIERGDLEKNNSYDMIFVDIQMPIIKGNALAKIINTNMPSIPIIAITGFLDNAKPKIKQQLAELGIKDVITKPATFEKIEEVIKKHTR